MSTLYELKEKLATVGDELKNVGNELMDKAANPTVPIDEITALQTKKGNLETRFNLIKSEHDQIEATQQAEIARKREQIRQADGISNAKDDKERMIAAKAEFIRAAISDTPLSDQAREILAVATPLRALPATGNTGQNFLPTTLITELIHEPFTTNPLRGAIGMSNIKGLELPRIAYELDDDGFITDAATAKEIQLTGDKVSFGRNKFKVKVRVSDTVLHGSDIELVSYVENALRSGLAAKEKKVSFASGSAIVTAEKHMTFYEEDGGASVIKEVTGADMYEAVTAAIADLHEDYRENAKVCMRFFDYIKMLKTLANGVVSMYDAPPEKIIGKPVIFSDAATIPIVGNFNYCRLNYDGDLIYDTDKIVDAGEYLWVLTAWFDQRRLLNSAFRLAVVEEMP